MPEITTSYKDGRVILDLHFHSALGSMSLEQKLELIESLSCDEHIIKHVADQITGRCTENGYYGASGATSAEPYTALDAAARQIAKASCDIAKEQIERLEAKLISQEKHHQEILKIVEERRRY